MPADFDSGSSNNLFYESGNIPATYPVSAWCWAYIASAETFVQLMSIADKDVSSQQHRMSIGDAGRLTVNTFSGGTTFQDSFSAIGSAIPIGEWAGCYGSFVSATSRKASMNGKSAVANTTTSNLTATLDRIALGTTADSTPNQFFNGQMSDAAMWSVELTAAEIAALNAGVSPLLIRPDALFFYAPLISGSVDVMGPPSTGGTVSYVDGGPAIRRPSAQVLRFPPAAAAPPVGGGGFSVIDRYYRTLMAGGR